MTTRPAFFAGVLRISRDGFTHAMLWMMLLLVYLLSGVLTFATNYVYRMGLMSLLIIPLVFVRGLRIERVLAGFALLTLEVVLSAFYNNSPLGDVIEFMRIPVFAYLMYYLVSVAVDEKKISRILRFLVIVACVQLPVVLLQWWSFDSLPASLKVNVGVIDYGFGTFNYKTDYSLSFLLTLLVTWLLFDEKRGRIRCWGRISTADLSHAKPRRMRRKKLFMAFPCLRLRKILRRRNSDLFAFFAASREKCIRVIWRMRPWTHGPAVPLTTTRIPSYRHWRWQL